MAISLDRGKQTTVFKRSVSPSGGAPARQALFREAKEMALSLFNRFVPGQLFRPHPSGKKYHTEWE